MFAALFLATLAAPRPAIIPGITSTGYQYVGKFREIEGDRVSPASCVDIGPRYVLTARHNTAGGVVDGDYLVTIGTTEFNRST